MTPLFLFIFGPMTVEELTTAAYERAAQVGLQTNKGPDTTSFIMTQFANQINYATSVGDTVMAQYLLDVATRKF